MNEQLIERIKKCPTLPSLPRVAIEILNLADDPDVAMPAMARIISQDAALVARTLKTVNSSFYGLSHTISGIDHALVVLGMEGIKTIVLGFSLVSDLKKAKPKGGFDHVSYWRRSIYAATAARIFAEQFKVGLVEECFLAALMMDIGMLALDQVLGRDYADVTERAPSHAGLAPLEMAKLGMTHADVTGVLATHWKLPEVLRVPMTHHHRPQALDDSAVKEVAQVVWLAGRCADVFVDAQPEWSLCDVRRTCMERYKIGELDCDAILCQIGLKTNQLAPLFDISLDAAGGHEAIVQRASEGLAKMTKALEEQQAAALLEGAAGASPSSNPADKRRAPRFSRGGALPIHPYVGGKIGEAMRSQFRDASAQGIGIVLPQPLALGSQFIIRLPQKTGEPLPILYTVVRSEALREGGFRTGAELTAVLRQQEAAMPSPAAPAARIASATPAAATNAEPAPVTSREDGLEKIRRAIAACA